MMVTIIPMMETATNPAAEYQLMQTGTPVNPSKRNTLTIAKTVKARLE